MAKKKETQDSPESPILVAAAKSVGTAAGKIASAVGIATPPKPKTPKLMKKNKSKLPRRQKKAAKKTAKTA